MMSSWSPRVRRQLGAAALAVMAATSVAACGSSRTGSSQAVAATQGDVEVIHPYVPAPASPSVAALYVTVRDVGTTPDALRGGSSPAAAMTMLMTEDSEGGGGTMAPLSRLDVPAHGEAALRPGQAHLMLENLTGPLRAGQQIRVTLQFERAGSVTVRVPVVPLSAS